MKHGPNLEDLLTPAAEHDLKRRSPSCYEEFIYNLYQDLRFAISTLKSGRQHHQRKSEDEISDHLISQLSSSYKIPLPRDNQDGGHCDFSFQIVSPKYDIYKWKAEAKLWKGKSWAEDGMSQLLDSYAHADLNNDQGSLLLYCVKPNPLDKLKEWKDMVCNMDCFLSIEETEDPYEFTSVHMSPSQIEYSVRHFFIHLHHPPYDAIRAKALHKDKALRKKLPFH